MKWLRTFRTPPKSRVRFGHPTDWRLIVDFTATRRPTARGVVLSDIEIEQLSELLGRLAPGTLVVICGLDRLPESAEEAARSVALAARVSRDIDICCDCDDARPRWRRRFIGNLVRFGCIQPDETITHDDLKIGAHHGRSRHRE